jgi:hypothetical protein
MSNIFVTEESLRKVKGRSFSEDSDAPERHSISSLLGLKAARRSSCSEPEGGTTTTTDTTTGTGILALFERKLLPSTLVYMFIWFTLSFGSYGISTWITVLFEDVGIGNVYASAFIFALANLPGNIVSILYVEQIGRRRLLFYGMLLAGLATVGFALGTSVPVVVVICATLFNAFSVAGW